MQRIGVDIIEVARIERAISRWDKSFLNRIYTSSELKLYTKRPQSLAARFAGKEAVIKLLESQPGKRPSWTDIEILNESSGKPEVHLHGYARAQAENLGLKEFSISLSHCRDYAIAMVTSETKPD